jgi:hypothetical protein
LFTNVLRLYKSITCLYFDIPIPSSIHFKVFLFFYVDFYVSVRLPLKPRYAVIKRHASVVYSNNNNSNNNMKILGGKTKKPKKNNNNTRGFFFYFHIFCCALRNLFCRYYPKSGPRYCKLHKEEAGATIAIFRNPVSAGCD